VLRTITPSWDRFSITADFYIAFQKAMKSASSWKWTMILSCPSGSANWRTRSTEYVIRTGQPLLIRSDLEKTRARLGITFRPEHPAKCLCAAPILLGSKPAGVMVANEHENANMFSSSATWT